MPAESYIAAVGEDVELITLVDTPVPGSPWKIQRVETPVTLRASMQEPTAEDIAGGAIAGRTLVMLVAGSQLPVTFNETSRVNFESRVYEVERIVKVRGPGGVLDHIEALVTAAPDSTETRGF